MCKKYVLPFIACCLILSISGCSRNLMAPAGLIGFGAESSSSGTKSFLSGSLIRDPYSGKFEVTIQKIEISRTGDDWVKISENKDNKVTTVEGTNIERVTRGIAVDNIEYHGVRVWFGPIFKEYSSDGSSVREYTDFDKYNPVVLSTRNGKLAYPFTIERDTETFIIFQIDYDFSFDVSMVTCRVTKFK